MTTFAAANDKLSMAGFLVLVDGVVVRKACVKGDRKMVGGPPFLSRCLWICWVSGLLGVWFSEKL